MIEIILISLFIHLWLNYKYGNSGVLACGLFAFLSHKKKMTDTEKELVLAKFKMLGIYNDVRGGDSCGFSIDNNIFKGIDKEAKFEDYLMRFILPLPDEHYTILGHDRKATAGIKVDIDNAHPFKLYKNETDTEGLLGKMYAPLFSNK